ncbi:hypothetical protein [Sphingomonas sp.]|uniref:hypothetical protein n=1 Tax=Sphingomonas sp. TaxID=28214 RepID=UPI003AFF8D5D
MSETVEEKTRRRRWLNLAELVAVAGVVIAALGLYVTWSDKRQETAERVAATTAGARLELSATAADDGRTLRLTDAKHDLTDVTIRYPKALGIGVQRPAGEPAVEAEPFREVLLKLTDGGADERTGRLPVLITASYVDGDATRTASGIYDVVWRTRGRFAKGRALDLTGLRLRQRGGSAAALDAAWAREKP